MTPVEKTCMIDDRATAKKVISCRSTPCDGNAPGTPLVGRGCTPRCAAVQPIQELPGGARGPGGQDGVVPRPSSSGARQRRLRGAIEVTRAPLAPSVHPSPLGAQHRVLLRRDVLEAIELDHVDGARARRDRDVA